MKRRFTILAMVFAGACAASAKTFPWRITGNDATAARFAAYQGESVAFDVSFSGAASNCTAQSAKIYYQTNGMDRAWWQTDGLVFAPSNDVGAASYRFFIRASDDLGANYTANGVLRMLPSPGFEPAVLAPPVQRLDFANIDVANAPYYTKAETDAAIAAIPGGGVSTNEVLEIVGPTIAAAQADFAATGSVYRAASLYDGGAYLGWRSTGGAQSPMRWGVYEPPSGGFSVFRPLAYLSELDFSTNNTALVETVTATTQPALDTLGNTVSEHETAIQAVTNDNAQTRQIVTTWENFLDGSNVVFSITNYISGTYSLDSAKLTIKELRDGSYREVYNSRDEILLHIDNFKTNDFRVATNQVIVAVNAAIGNKADRDWGKYTSAGGEAPSNTVYMTAPNTVFAGGLEYERVAVGEGTVCVLTTHGAPVWTQGDEGTFKFQDDGGTNYFGFAKTDSYTIGADADGITVQSGMVTMNYNITMSGRPCIWYKANLTSNTPWEQLNLPDGSPVAGASHIVTWEQNPPANSQVCYINVGNQPQGFFRATVEVAGEAKFMTNMPADLSGGIICPNTATGVNGVIKPTFNGSTVIWTWSAQ